jgi:hypothetical protein
MPIPDRGAVDRSLCRCRTPVCGSPWSSMATLTERDVRPATYGGGTAGMSGRTEAPGTAARVHGHRRVVCRRAGTRCRVPAAAREDPPVRRRPARRARPRAAQARPAGHHGHGRALSRLLRPSRGRRRGGPVRSQPSPAADAGQRDPEPPVRGPRLGRPSAPGGFRQGVAAGLFTADGRHIGFLSLLSADPSQPSPADRSSSRPSPP